MQRNDYGYPIYPNEYRKVSTVQYSTTLVCSQHHQQQRESLLRNAYHLFRKIREFHNLSGLSLDPCGERTILDLYMLYNEVMRRGGFVRVLKEGKWPEVASALNFNSIGPKTWFQLQEIYANLFYKFELTYFHEMQEKSNVPTGAHLTSNPIEKLFKDPSINVGGCLEHQGILCQSSEDSIDPGAQVGNAVVGAIENEFDSGYLVNVQVGSEKLNGLLYQVGDSSLKQFAVVSSLMDGVGLEDPDSEPVGLQIRVGSAEQESNFRSLSEIEPKIRSKVGSPTKKVSKDPDAPMSKRNSYQFLLRKECDRLKKLHGKNLGPNVRKDPDAPMSKRNSYQFFLSKECDRLKKLHGKSLGPNVRKMVIDVWKSLPESERQPYIEESLRDEERFNQEKAAYHKRKNIQNNNGKMEYKTNNLEEYLEHKTTNLETNVEYKTTNSEANVEYKTSNSEANVEYKSNTVNSETNVEHKTNTSNSEANVEYMANNLEANVENKTNNSEANVECRTKNSEPNAELEVNIECMNTNSEANIECMTNYSEAIFHEVDSCVPSHEPNEFLMHEGSMTELINEMMENARQLDATGQINVKEDDAFV